MSGIRVTYSGLISFIIGIFSLFTGLVFTIIVTRELSQNEFGTWSLLGGLISYVLVFSPIISYWTTREIARGEETGKTALASAGIFSTISLLIFIVIAYSFGTYSEIDRSALLLASILVPLEFLRNVLLAINHGYKPQTGEYGLLVFELTKIPMALILVHSLKMGFEGVILSVAIANFASVIFLIIRSKEKIKGKLKIEYIKKWLRLFWLPTYPNLKSIFTQSDVVVFTAITGSVQGLAFWGAARAISVISNHSQKISKGLYPKLLQGGKKEFLQENFTRVTYFALPLMMMSIVFAEPALFVLNPIYRDASLVVLFSSLVIFLRTIGNVFTQSLTGIEKVDVKKESSFIDYLKSRLFFVPTMVIVERGVYLASLIIMLIIFSSSSSQLELVTYWAIVSLITQIPFTVYFYILTKREFPFEIEKIIALKYLLTSLGIFGGIFLLMENYLEYNPEIFEFLPNLLLFVILGIIGYVGITYLIDNKTRKLCKLIITEMKRKGKQI